MGAFVFLLHNVHETLALSMVQYSKTFMLRIFVLALANGLSGLHFFLLAYATAPYLAQFLSSTYIGLVYSTAALLTVLGFITIPHVLKKRNARTLALFIATIDILVLLSLAWFPIPFVAIGLIALQGALAPLIAYTLDIFLESATENEDDTGFVRGIFLTAVNLSLVVSPLLIGILLGEENTYAYVFLASACAIAVFMGLVVARQKDFTHPARIETVSFRETFSCLSGNPVSRTILILNTALQCFFLWAPVYVPLYLHTQLGIPWSTLGPIFAVMLIPFVLTALPVGQLLDRKRVEREILALGFIIIGISFAALSFIRPESILLIGIALFVTRIGAAFIEIAAETSFFRSVGGADANSVSVFRMTRPLGMFLGPIIGSVLLLIFPINFIFVPLGLFLLFLVPLTFHITGKASVGKTVSFSPTNDKTLVHKST